MLAECGAVLSMVEGLTFFVNYVKGNCGGRRSVGQAVNLCLGHDRLRLHAISVFGHGRIPAGRTLIVMAGLAPP